MKYTCAFLCVVGVQVVSAQAPMSPAVITPAARLVAIGDSLSPAASRTAQLGGGPGYTYALTHRDSSGGLELHRDWTDVFVIEAGSATLLSGGTLEGASESTPGEWRGGSARGATRAPLRVGDVVVIPAGTPHQMLLAGGERISYIAFKVAKPPVGSP
jgi:mannose-6-phosphate isomerase-like protein (cupin superfamily)